MTWLSVTEPVEERTLFASAPGMPPFAETSARALDTTSLEWIEELVRAMLVTHQLPPPVLQRGHQRLQATWSFIEWEVVFVADRVRGHRLTATRHADGEMSERTTITNDPAGIAGWIAEAIRQYRWGS